MPKYGQNEGFTIITIPEQRFKSCSGCKFLERKMIRSGRDPVYANNCEHPQNYNRIYRFSGGNLTETEKGYVLTPDWCPFLKKQTPKQ